jgi:hypothetical protein
MLLTAIEHRFLVEEFEFPMTETKLVEEELAAHVR